MRIRILSDIHIEFEPYRPSEVEADLVILAGDIGVGLDGIRWAQRHFPDLPVVYIAGNHEYYGHSLPDYLIGRTRVVSNPKGYPQELCDKFRPDFMVEV